MRKIILLLVSLAFLILNVSAASTIYDITISPKPLIAGQCNSVTVQVNEPRQGEDVEVIFPQIGVVENITKTSSNGFEDVILPFPSCPIVQQITVHVILWDSVEKMNKIDERFMNVDVVNMHNLVPEFPSNILPVAVILGIVLVVGRKKK